MPKIAALGGMSSRGFGEFARQAAGAYIEDVFSTYLYNGTDAPQTIANGIDLSGNGGLVWLKSRSGTVVTGYDKHILFDTVRTNTNSLSTNSTAAVESGWSDLFFRFKANGFDFGTSTSTADQSYLNNLGVSYASWTFGKKQKFFDIVSYTGNATARDITHSLGSTPGFIIIKRRDAIAQWPTWHRSLPANNVIFLNQTTATQTVSGYVTAVSSTTFSIGTQNSVNANGGSFIAYLFAHDAGGFGADGSQNAISCGSFSAGTTVDVNLGYEPQYVLLKCASDAGSWWVSDIMRGMSNTDWVFLQPNLVDAEANTGAGTVIPTATGFTFKGANLGLTAGQTMIYMAIRRGPMRVPTDATKVLNITKRTGTNTATTVGSILTDSALVKKYNDSKTAVWADRLRGAPYLQTTTTSAEATSTTDAFPANPWDVSSGFRVAGGGTLAGGFTNYTGDDYVNYAFQRAPGFFDVVCYTGTGTNDNKNHNLSVVPELVILKARSSALSWYVLAESTILGGSGRYLVLDSTAAYGTGVTRQTWTSSTFSVGSLGDLNGSGTTYVAYLFVTCPGVSKVGSYTGTGATQTISCGFTGGARYVLIKRTDSTGDWWFWDTARGMVSGTDPRLAYNSTAAETNANWVYTTTGGFQIVTSDATVNANGGSYIYLAIA